jgi:hypothetical protein
MPDKYGSYSNRMFIKRSNASSRPAQPVRSGKGIHQNAKYHNSVVHIS